jgi:hypothetical protein
VTAKKAPKKAAKKTARPARPKTSARTATSSPMSYADIAPGGAVQLDDGSHGSVYVLNRGQGHLVIEPGGQLLRPGDSAVIAVQPGAPVSALSGPGTAITYVATGA